MMKKRLYRVLSVILAVVVMISGLYICTATLNTKTAKAAEAQWMWPVPDSQSLSRGFSSDHDGLDITAGSNVPIVASKSGTVIAVIDGDVPNKWVGYGKGVVINHGDGYYSHYAHMSSTTISQGQRVSQGQLIGYMGATGNATGRHLHFAIATSMYGAGGRINNNKDAINYVYNAANNPQGCIDLVSGGDGTITVAGWAFDRDNPNASIEVHVYVGGDAASGEGHIVYANQYREDVNSAYSIGGNHGFSDTWTVSKRGTQSVYFYLINIGGGGNVLMDPHTVTINNPAPVATAAPVVTPVPTKTPVPVVTPAPTVKPTIIASPTVRPSSVPVATFTPVSTSIPISTIEPGSGTESSEKVAPNPPSFKLKGIKKGFKVTITKEAGNSWYDIEYSTKSSMSSARTTTIFQDGGSTKKVTWLKRKKKYYVRVRSYNGLNGPWSYIRIVRTK